MPFEGNLITWDGAEIPWPWHFGGIFGVLDASAVGQVSWDPSGEGPSPARGGGWMDARSKASSDGPEGIHGSVECGTINGSLAAWGRRGDWSFQASLRRTWLDPALALAYREGWTSEKMTILFWDGTGAIAWSNGPWNARIGAFLSEDSLSLGTNTDYSLVSSWRNSVVPVGLSWDRDGWRIEADGSWSEYSRRDEDLSARDTLDQISADATLRKDLSGTAHVELGTRTRRWNSGYAESWHRIPGFPGDDRRTLWEPWVAADASSSGWTGRAWAGIARTERDPAAPQGGARLSWNSGPWNAQADLVRRIVPLGVVASLTDGTETASPVWMLPPGASPRTTALHISVLRSQAGSDQIPSTEFRGLGWLRSTEGLWQWEGSWDYTTPNDSVARDVYRQDAGSAGVDFSGRITFGRLDLVGRQSVSWDVVRRRPEDGTTFPSRWAPWDQRYQTEFAMTWAWLGRMRSPPGKTFLRTGFSLHRTSGTLRASAAGWTATSTGQDIDTFNLGWRRIDGSRRAPYLRLDATPLEFGREGSWSAFWTVLNITSEKNSVGWFSSDVSESPHELDQIPFLPVVFGVRILF